MTLDFGETKLLIDRVLSAEKGVALEVLQSALRDIDRTMPEFYEGVIQHALGMTYTSDQWLDFHLKVPHWRLLAEKSLMDKLSPAQRARVIF